MTYFISVATILKEWLLQKPLSLCSLKTNTFVDVYELCPNVKTLNRKKLSLIKEVIGLVLHYVDDTRSYVQSTVTVSHILYKYWIVQNIYPITRQGILKKLKKSVELFKKLAQTSVHKRGKTWQEHYEDFRKTYLHFDEFWSNKN